MNEKRILDISSKVRSHLPRILFPLLAIAVVLSAFALLGVSGAGCANIVTPAGHEGYIKTRPLVTAAEYDGTQTGPTSTGWVWRRTVTNIDMRPRTFSEDMRILTAERLELHFHAHARIKLRDGAVRNVVEDFGGTNWYEANVQQQFRSVVRGKVQALDAFAVKDQMGKIGDDVLAELKARYRDGPIEFLSVDIGNIEYPEVVVKSVVRKFVTNEDNDRKDIELQIAQKGIEIGVAEAEGVADSQSIIRTTLDPMFLQYEALKVVEELAGSNNTTFIIMPFSENANAPIIMSLGDK